MAPRKSQGLQERAWDAPTKGLEWIGDPKQPVTELDVPEFQKQVMVLGGRQSYIKRV